jgi:hypothetical protein
MLLVILLLHINVAIIFYLRENAKTKNVIMIILMASFKHRELSHTGT